MSRSIKFLALTFSEGLNVLVSFLFLPYLARAMDIGDYGTYGQTLLIVDLAKGFFAFGLAKIIFTFLANDQYKKSLTLSNNIIAAFVLGLIATLLILLSSSFLSTWFGNNKLTQLLWLYALSVPFQLVFSSLNSALIFFDKVKQSAVIAVTTNLLRVSLIVMAVQLFSSLQLIFVALILVALVQSTLAYWLLPSYCKSPFTFDQVVFKKQIISGAPLGLTALLGVAFWTMDGFMVSSMLNVEEYAIYRNGAFQIPFISAIYGAVTAILLPDVSTYFHQGKYAEIVQLKRRIITNTAMLVIPTVLFCIVFAHPLITTYLSEKYALSSSVFMIYNLMLLVRFTSYDDLFIASDNNRYLPKIYFISLSINGLLNYVLINSLGINGAAIASVISFYFLVAWLFSKGASFVNHSILDFLELNKLLAILFYSALVSTLCYWAYSFIGNSILLLICLGVFYLIIYHTVLKQNLVDRSIIENLLLKLGRDNFALKILHKYY